MPAQHHPLGQPVHAAEREGIAFLVRELPPDYHVFSNIDLPTGRGDGSMYEHDAVVVAPHAVFTVELKSWGGRIAGNRDRWTLADGKTVQSPISLLLSKAKTLKGLLQSRDRAFQRVRVEGFVFLTPSDAVPDITPDFSHFVLTRRDLVSTLTNPDWLQAMGAQPLSVGMRWAAVQVLGDGRRPHVLDRIGDYKLQQRLPSEDRPYEAWLALSDLTQQLVVLHVHTLAGDSDKIRSGRRKAALREATLHEALRGGSDVLDYRGYFTVDEDPQRVVLTFEDTTPLLPALTWLAEQKPGIHARLQVAARLCRALALVHGKQLVHRRLSGEALLVEASAEPNSVRLCAFDLARDLTGNAPTITGGSLDHPSFRCTAPEVLRGAEATVRSDLFSLGATLFELLTGRPLFQRVDEVLQPFAVPEVALGHSEAEATFHGLLRALLAVSPADRPENARVVVQALEQVLGALDAPPVEPALQAGRVLRQTYELVRPLGTGATATTWLARHTTTGAQVTLKVGSGGSVVAALQLEADVLRAVTHERLVRFYNLEPGPDGALMLVLAHADGETASLWAEAGDPLTPVTFDTFASGLLGAVGALHAAGWMHRDIKPDNIILAEPSAEPTLLDLGLASRAGQADELAVGSARYKDPLVYVEGRWTPANDLYASALVLYQVLTGAHPFGMSPPDEQRPAMVDAELVPDAFSPEQRARLAAAFTHALSPVREQRPKDAAALLQALRGALADGATVQTAEPVPSPSWLRPDMTPETAVQDLPLASRSHGALVRLGARTLRDLATLDLKAALRLPSVGSKIVRELEQVVGAVRAQWPGLAARAPAIVVRFCPEAAELVGSLDELDAVLPQRARRELESIGVLTTGELAALPDAAVADLDGVGRKTRTELRVALRRLAGVEERPTSWSAWVETLREETGEPAWAVLEALTGLRGGRVRSVEDVAEVRGWTPARVHTAAALGDLHTAASAAQFLAALADETLPAAGLLPLDDCAVALVERLPLGDEGLNALGLARFAGLLLQHAESAAGAADLEIVARPAWTLANLSALHVKLADLGAWPSGRADWRDGPITRGQAARLLWDLQPEPLLNDIVRRGGDAESLLAAALKCVPDVTVSRSGWLHTPPVPLDAALRWQRPTLRPQETADGYAEAVRQEWAAVLDGDLPSALRAAGYVPHERRWCDPARTVLPELATEVLVDPTIQRQRLLAGAPPAIQSLVASRAQGGLRLLCLPPGQHHKVAAQVVTWLRQALGDAEVRVVNVDRLLIDALHHAGYWDFASQFETNPNETWHWAEPVLKQALDDVALAGKPGDVTVFTNPALLGTLRMMPWLSGFYDRARGGRHGLNVLCLPGGVHDNRVRLNETWNLPYVPDMAAVFLEAA
jgi:serine/threonine protein kinase